MIQTKPQQTPSYQTANLNEALPASPYILRRILYTVILVALLLLMCFYFDLLDDYDLVSMILGFSVCIILQFTLLSYYFSEEMEALQMDEIGVVKEKIKLVFGQLNPTQLEKKVREKYYRRQASEEDKLFSESNDRIYQSVMKHLRGKSQPNFSQLINKIKGKWFSLEHKIKIFEDYLIGVLKVQESRRLVYQRHKNRLKRIIEKEEHRFLTSFLGINIRLNPTNFQNLHDTTYYSQDSQVSAANILNQLLGGGEQERSNQNNLQNNLKQANVDWGILTTYMLQKTKLVEKEAGDLKERVFQDFQGYASTVRSDSSTNAKKRQKLYEDYRTSLEEKNRILNELQKTGSKIMELSSNLPGNQIEGGEIEVILKKQFDLRLLKIESQNLLIKISSANSAALANADSLHDHLQEENRALERFLDIFKSKINLYMHQMADYGQKRGPSLKKHIKEAETKPIQDETMTPDMEPEVLYSIIMRRRNREGSFKGYLDQNLRELEELQEEHLKAKSALQQLKTDLDTKQSMDAIRGAESRVGVSTGARIFYFTSTINDDKLTRIFDDIIKIEKQHCQSMIKTLKLQLGLLRQFETDTGAQFGYDLKHRYEEYKRKDQELKRSKKRYSKQQADNPNDILNAQLRACRNRLVQLILNYESKCKIANLLPDLLSTMAKHDQDYQKFASEIVSEQTPDLKNQRNNEEERKKQKFTAFSSCLPNEDIIDEWLTSADRNNLMKNENEHNINKDRYLLDIWRENKNKLEEKLMNRGLREGRHQQFFKYEENSTKSLEMVNRILSILFNEWRNSQFFHDMIKQQLLISLNRKKPDIVEHLRIDFFRIIEKDKQEIPIKNLRAHPSQIYRCLFDMSLNFKGKIAVKIVSRFKIGNKPQLKVKLMIKEFRCPIRVCFTPFSIGKSYASLLDKPQLTIDYNVTVGQFELTKIPLFTPFIKTYAVLKLRKKFLWPKRITLSLPLAFKSTLELAIQQRINFQKERERLSKKSK